MIACKREAQLKRPVVEFLKQLGCDRLKTELKFVDRGVDVFAIKSGRRRRSYAVELKLRDWQKALRQAAIYQLCADYSYVAMPHHKAERLNPCSFQEAGVGLLSVDLGLKIVTVVCAARMSSVKREAYVSSLEESLKS